MNNTITIKVTYTAATGGNATKVFKVKKEEAIRVVRYLKCRPLGFSQKIEVIHD